MSFQDPPRRQRPPRYPTLANYEDGYPSSQGYQSYSGTQASYEGGNGYAHDYRGFAGLAGAQDQHAPWDDAWEQPTEREAPRRTSGPFLPASDDFAVGEYSRGRNSRDGGQRRSKGLLAGAVAGFLAAAVAIGVANLVAAFVRPQASPIIAVGGAFIDRTPPALKNFAVEKFGENDKNMLLLGMYVTIALIAIVVGVLAWRRVWIGVAGIGLFGLFGAFVAITRPESRVTDVIPSVVGGIAGIVAIAWLTRMGTPRGRYRGEWTGGIS